MATIPKFLRRCVATALLVAFGAASVNADATDDRIAALQAKFRCPIFEYLVTIHSTSTKLKDRYLVVEIRTKKRHYAQCVFYSKAQKMHCEAESPFYFSKKIERRFRLAMHLPV